MQPKKPATILIAEDDDDHYFLTEKILRTTSPDVSLYRANNGEELMEFLFPSARFRNFKAPLSPQSHHFGHQYAPKNGWEALKEIKTHPELRLIPVVILTTSDEDDDKMMGYELGANSYIRKPIEFRKWVEMIHAMNQYWFDTVELPDKGSVQ